MGIFERFEAEFEYDTYMCKNGMPSCTRNRSTRNEATNPTCSRWAELWTQIWGFGSGPHFP
jgi:hypothetical protein